MLDISNDLPPASPELSSVIRHSLLRAEGGTVFQNDDLHATRDVPSSCRHHALPLAARVNMHVRQDQLAEEFEKIALRDISCHDLIVLMT